MADKDKKVKAKDKEQLQLPTGLKVETINKDDLAKVKEKHSKLSPISETAQQMSKKMLADGSGASILLNNPTLQAAKETIRKVLRRDLERVANRQKLRLSTRVVEEADKLVFYYEQRREVVRKDKHQNLTIQPSAAAAS